MSGFRPEPLAGSKPHFNLKLRLEAYLLDVKALALQQLLNIIDYAANCNRGGWLVIMMESQFGITCTTEVARLQVDFLQRVF
jgi:hypothetical protein